MKILITGASGFIGSHLAEKLLSLGHEVWCGVRATTSRKYLSDPRLHFTDINLSSQENIMESLRNIPLDVVVHAAGATKCRRKEDFYTINTLGTQHLVDALEALYPDTAKPRFIFVSSLSVVNSIPSERLGSATAYGDSKYRAEEIVRRSPLPYVILRPTGVYGPREKDYFLMVKSIRQHIDFSVGFKPQRLTFVYVSDVVQAIVKSITQPAEKVVCHTFTLSDGAEYSSETFSDLIISALEETEGRRPFVLRLRLPLFVLRVVCFFGEWYNRLTGRLTTLNADKYNILSQRDWRCDISSSRELLGYSPEVLLAEGVRKSVKWYKDNKWI